MATDTTYNGWSNYATWNVALWLDNDEYECNDHMLEQAREFYIDAANHPDYTTREKEAMHKTGEWLKDYINEMNPLADDASMFSDLLQSALDDVNWNEIAEHYIDETDKEEFAETEEETEEETNA